MSSTYDFSNVSSNGFGTMNFTWRPEPVALETTFDILNEVISVNSPQKTFINAGEFYGPDFSNLKYLQAFFAKYPDQRQQVVISVKGAVDFQTFLPAVDAKGIKESIDRVLQYIPDLEIFEPARLDPEVPLEVTIKALDEAIDSGKIKGFTLSEVGAATLRKASELSRHGVSGCEVEFSLFTRDILKNDTAKVAGELGVPIIAYSPLSRGFLTGSVTSKEDIPEGDVRNISDRFSEENIKKNLVIVEGLKKIASSKGITPAQLALSWIRYYSNKTINGVKYPMFIPIPSCSSVKRVHENFEHVELTSEEFEQVEKYISASEVSGHRYNEHMSKYLSV